MRATSIQFMHISCVYLQQLRPSPSHLLFLLWQNSQLLFVDTRVDVMSSFSALHLDIIWSKLVLLPTNPSSQSPALFAPLELEIKRMEPTV